MKNSFYFPVALLLWVVIAMTACNKEQLLNEPPQEHPLALQNYGTENYTVQNGLLVFDQYQEVNALVTTLRNMEKDQNTRHVAYSNIGITSAIRNSDVNYTDHPVCQQFEQEKGYISQRSTEESFLFAELAAGNEDINSIIDRPYLKTILNEHGAVKIGSRIFKLYDSGLTAIIGNSDWQTYEQIKNMPESEITERYNLRLTSKDKEDLHVFYAMNEDKHVIAPKAVHDFRIQQQVTTDGQIEVVNHSYLESVNGEAALYEWEYPDGTRSIGQNPVRTYAPGETIKVRTNWPGDDWDDDPWWEQQADDRSCAIPDFKMIPLGNRTFRFELENPPTIPGSFIRWDFGDGNTATGIAVEHTYGASVSDLVQVTCSARRSNGSVLCEFTKPLSIDPECTLRNLVKGDEEFMTNSGERWRLDVKIWIDNSIVTTGDVGSGSKSLKHNGVGFFGKKTEQIWITLEGFHFRRIGGECIVHERPFGEESETDSGNVQRNLTDDNDPRIIPNQLWSTHKMQVDGEIFEFSKNGGKLFLN